MSAYYVEELSLEAWMTALDVVAMSKKHKGKLPEAHFLERLGGPALDAVIGGQPTKEMKIRDFVWHGEGSSTSEADEALRDIATVIHGRVEVVLFRRGGPWGFRIVDGAFTECDVVMTLQAKG